MAVSTPRPTAYVAARSEGAEGPLALVLQEEAPASNRLAILRREDS
jgi:hypothetical protein